jgi:hypothetical protein
MDPLTHPTCLAPLHPNCYSYICHDSKTREQWGSTTKRLEAVETAAGASECMCISVSLCLSSPVQDIFSGTKLQPVQLAAVQQICLRHSIVQIHCSITLDHRAACFWNRLNCPDARRNKNNHGFEHALPSPPKASALLTLPTPAPVVGPEGMAPNQELVLTTSTSTTSASNLNSLYR